MRTNHLNLLLVLVLVLFPMSTRAYGAGECVMLYTPYTKIAVPPGESINYSVDVINNCDEVKNSSFHPAERISGRPSNLRLSSHTSILVAFLRRK